MNEIIISYLITYFSIILGGIIYVNCKIGSIDEYVSNFAVYLVLIIYIITILFLYQKNKRTEKHIKLFSIFPFFSLGISIAIIINMVIFKVYPANEGFDFSLLLLFSSGIIGPIYEEILFRYVLFYRLKKRFSRHLAIFLDVIIFGIIHFSPIKVIYAMIVGLFLVISYDKYQSILYPIAMHIGANCIVLFLYKFNLTILFLAIINFIINIYLIFYKTKTS